MTGHAIIIIVVGMILLGSMVIQRIETTSTSIVANTSNAYKSQAAQNIAQSGVNMGLRKLAQDRNWRTGFSLMNLLGGKVTVTVKDTTWYGQSVISISSTGIVNYGQSSERREASTAFLRRAIRPTSVKSVITTDGATSLEGNPIVDGRDHTLAGVVIPNQGTYALWSTGTMSAQGNPKLGGTVLGVDIAPANPYNPAVIKTVQSWPAYPTTPDSVLGGASNGFPEGTLKALAQTGAGNQYVTNPASLTYPLKGVTYVELPSGGKFSNTDITGSGILIIHNSAKNALDKDCILNFKGLVLVDDVSKASDIPHSTPPVFMGSVFVMSPSGAAIRRMGNSDGSLLYSSEAILNAIDAAFMSTNGSPATVVAWWE